MVLSLAESGPLGQRMKVGDIVISDDSEGANLLSLTGADTGFFEIVGTELFLKAGTNLDFETKQSYSVAVQIDDAAFGAGPEATSAVYTLSVNDVLVEPIVGTDGPDSLGGTSSADVMQGRGGDDTYVVDNPGDQVVEGAAQGTDIVLSAISYILSANVENLTLIGGGAINGTGNELANVIVGDDGNNVLEGREGTDLLTGGLGTDRFVFNTAPDAVSNLDTITDFFVPDDTILLDNAIFTKLKKDGALKKKYFEVGKKADDKDDYIIHNKKTGVLSYDADGAKKKIDAIAFADLAEGLKLKADDFLAV